MDSKIRQIGPGQNALRRQIFLMVHWFTHWFPLGPIMTLILMSVRFYVICVVYVYLSRISQMFLLDKCKTWYSFILLLPLVLLQSVPLMYGKQGQMYAYPRTFYKSGPLLQTMYNKLVGNPELLNKKLTGHTIIDILEMLNATNADNAFVNDYAKMLQVYADQQPVRQIINQNTASTANLLMSAVPEVTCQTMVRLGLPADGGKWVFPVCNPWRAGDNCIVYSLGVGDRVGFETEIAKYTDWKCAIHSFDPNGRLAPLYDHIKNNTTFHPWTIKAYTKLDKNYMSIQDVMKKLGHHHVSILKVTFIKDEDPLRRAQSTSQTETSPLKRSPARRSSNLMFDTRGIASRRSSATTLVNEWTGAHMQPKFSNDDSLSLGTPALTWPLSHSVGGSAGHMDSPLPSPLLLPTPEPKTRCGKICGYVHKFYEKSHIKRLFPILILISYSFLGGALFYMVEEPHENLLHKTKADYIMQQKENMLNKIMEAKEIHLYKDDPIPDCSPFLRDYDYIYRKTKLFEGINVNLTHPKDPVLDFAPDAYSYVLSLYYLSDHPHQKNQYDSSNNVSSIIYRIENVQYQIKYLAMRCCELVLMLNEDRNNTEQRFLRDLKKFEEDADLDSKLVKQWTFWNAMFVATTTYTTIGYGNIVPDTHAGKVIAMFYAVVGIPLVLMILHKMGRVFLSLLQGVWDWILRIFIWCRCVQQKDLLKKKSTIILDTSGGRESYDIPVALAIGVTFVWMFSCAGIFMLIEKDWDFFKAFYFYFISVTTIGFGDVVPSSDANVFLMFFFIIMGLSLFSMCINVVQIQIERLFEDLMLQMMEEYQTAQVSDGTMPEPPPDIQKGVDITNMWHMWKQRRKMQKQRSKSYTGAKTVDEEAVASTALRPEARRSRFNMNKLFAPMMGNKRRITLISEWERRAQMRVAWTQTDIPRTRTIATQTNHNKGGNANGKAEDSESSGKGKRRFSGTIMPQIPETGSSNNSSSASLASSKSRKKKLLQFPASICSFDAENAGSNIGKISRAISPCFSEPVFVTTKDEGTSPPSSKTTTYYSASSGGSLPSSIEAKFKAQIQDEEDYRKGGWTFVNSHETGTKRIRRGSLPRGLVPNMYMKRVSRSGGDELRELMKEIDMRILDCRKIANQTNAKSINV